MKSILFILILLALTCCKYDKQVELPTFGVFWKITGNGLKNTSYLLGTYHGAGGKQILDSIKSIDSIMNSSDQFICESIKDFSNSETSITDNPPKKPRKVLKPWPVADSTYNNLLTERQIVVYDSLINTDKFLQFIHQKNWRPMEMMSVIKFILNKGKNRQQD